MKITMCLCVALALIIYPNSTVTSPMGQSMYKRAPKRYCGSDLSGFLSVLCIHGYNKRDGNPYLDNRDDDSYEEFIPFYLYRTVLMPNEDGRYDKVTRSLTDDCCTNPCSQRTLEKYCKKDPNLL